MSREKLPVFDLKAARETRKLSQSDVAAILCTTQASVSRWEASGCLPAIYRKAWLAHWKLEDLLNGKAKAKIVRGNEMEPTNSTNKALHKGSSGGFVEGRRRSVRHSSDRDGSQAGTPETEPTSSKNAN